MFDRDSLGIFIKSVINEHVLLPQEKFKQLPCSRYVPQRYSRQLCTGQGDSDYIDKDGTRQWIRSTFSDIAGIAEGRAWVETIEGYRVPYAYYAAASHFRNSPLKGKAVKRDAYGFLSRTEEYEQQALVDVAKSSFWSLAEPAKRPELSLAENHRSI